MSNRLIDHPIRSGEFRVRWINRGALLTWEEQKQYDRSKKKLKTALRKHHQIGVDSDGFEVWVTR